MAQDKPEIILSASIDEAKSKKQIQQQIDRISKGLNYDGMADKESKAREKALQYEQKTRIAQIKSAHTQALAINKKIDLDNKRIADARVKYEADFQKLLKQEELQISKTRLQELRINKQIESDRERVLKEEQNIRYNLQRIQDKSLSSEKMKTDEIEKQREKVALFQAEMERKSSKLMAGQYGSRVDTSALESLKSKVSGISVDPENLRASTTEMNKLGSQFKDISTNSQLASRGIKGFGEDLSHNLKKFGEWMVASTLFYGVFTGLNNGIQTIFELDKAMTELAKVSDYSATVLENFKNQSFDLAKSLGVSATEVVKATTEFVRAGYGLEEATKAGQEAIMLKNISDTATNVEETSAVLISTLKGLGKEASYSSHILDSLNEVSNKFAVSNNDLAESLKRSTAVLSLAGNEYDQIVGLLSGATEVLQQPEKVSRNLNTISQRLQGINEEGKHSTILFAEMESAFNEINMTILKADGGFKSTYDILMELSNIMPTLTERQKSWISELIAGKDGLATIKAIQQNIEGVKNATEASKNSTGSALVEQEKYLKSLEGRWASAKTQVQEFYVTLINTNAIKGLISAFTSLTFALTQVNKVFGGLPIILGTATLALALFNKELLITIVGGFKSFIVMIPEIIAMVSRFGVSATLATAGVTSFQVALAGATLGITAIIGAIIAYNNHQQQMIDNLTDVSTKLTEASSKSSEITSLILTLQTLGNTATKTAEQEQEYIDTQTKLQQLLPQSKNMIDSKNMSLEKQIEIYSELNKQQRESAILEASKLVTSEQSGYEKNIQLLEELNVQYEKNAQKLSELEQKRLFGQKLNADEQREVADLADIQSELGSQRDLLTLKTETYEKAQQFLKEAYKQSAIEEAKLIDTSKAHDSQISSLTSRLSQYGLTIQDVKKGNYELKDSVNAVDNSHASFMAKLPTLFSNYELLTQAKKDLINQGYLEEEVINQIDSLYNGKFIPTTKYSKEVMLDFINGKLLGDQNRVNSEISTTTSTIAEIQKRIQAYQAEARVIASLAKATFVSQFKGMGDLGKAFENIDVNKFADKIAPQYLTDLKSQLTEAEKDLGKLKMAKARTFAIDKSYAGKSKKTKGSSTPTTPFEPDPVIELDRYQELNLFLEKNNTLLSKNKALQESLAKDDPKRINLIKQEIQLLKYKQQGLHNLAEEQRKERDELIKKLQSKNVKFKGALSGKEADNTIAENYTKEYKARLAVVNKLRTSSKDAELYRQKKKDLENFEKEFKRFNDLQLKLIPDQGNAWWKTEKEIRDAQDSITDIFKEANEKRTKAVADLRDMIRDMIEQEIKDLIDVHKDNIEFAKEELDIRLKILEAEKDLADFAKDRAGKEKEINKISNKMLSLKTAVDQGDLKAKDQYTKLQDEKAKLQESYDDMINDRTYEKTKERLEDEFDAYEKKEQNQIDVLEDNLKNAEYMMIETNKRINAKLIDGTNPLYEQLIEWNRKYGTGFDQDVIGKWKEAIELIKEYNTAVTGVASGKGDFTFEGYEQKSANIDVISKMKQIGSQWSGADANKKKQLNEQNKALASSIGYRFYSKDGRYYPKDYSDEALAKLTPEQRDKIKLYDNGGFKPLGQMGVMAEGVQEWVMKDKNLLNFAEISANNVLSKLPNMLGIIPQFTQNSQQPIQPPNVNITIQGNIDNNNINKITESIKQTVLDVSQGQLDAFRMRGVKSSIANRIR